MRPMALVLIVLVSTTLLTGCLGGDDDPKTGTDETPGTMEEGTGSIEGRVLTLDLEEVEGANVALVAGADLLAEATTNERGDYEIANIEPGSYRVQISAACCRQEARSVQVVEGETTTVDVQLAPFTSDDLQEYRVERYEWTGFLACGYVLVVIADDACSAVDEEAERTHPFQLEVGIETMTAVLVWDSIGLLGESLQFGLAQDPCEGTSCTTPDDYYGFADGVSPLTLRIDGGGSQSFSGIEEPADVQLRVFPPFSSNVDLFYQQEFTVHYQLHYHQPAPEGFDPMPDM